MKSTSTEAHDRRQPIQTHTPTTVPTTAAVAPMKVAKATTIPRFRGRPSFTGWSSMPAMVASSPAVTASSPTCTAWLPTTLEFAPLAVWLPIALPYASDAATGPGARAADDRDVVPPSVACWWL